MDTKQLIDKFVKGDITEEEFDAEKAKLTPEQLVELDKAAEEAKPSAVEVLKGIRRGATKILDGVKEKDESAISKLREENLTAAKQKVFTELGIKEEDRAAFEEGFKNHDSGAINVDGIAADMRKYYASNNADELLTLKQQQQQREQEAEEFNAQQGGANGGSGDGGKEMIKVSKEVQDHIKASAALGFILTPEQAQKQLDLKKRGGHLE